MVISIRFDIATYDQASECVFITFKMIMTKHQRFQIRELCDAAAW
jgi:hypothetical protein